MLTSAGGLADEFSRFCSAMSPPKVVAVSAHEASSMVASGAAAEEYSASRIALPSLPVCAPGLTQLLVPVLGAGCTWTNLPEVYLESPKVLRNVVQSAVEKTLVFSMTTMVWPLPVRPAEKSLLR